MAWVSVPEEPAGKTVDPVLAELRDPERLPTHTWLMPSEEATVKRENDSVTLANLRNSSPAKKRVTKWTPKRDPSPKPLRRPVMRAKGAGVFSVRRMATTPRGTEISSHNKDAEDAADDKELDAPQKIAGDAPSPVITIQESPLQPSMLAQFERVREAQKKQAANSAPQEMINKRVKEAEQRRRVDAALAAAAEERVRQGKSQEMQDAIFALHLHVEAAEASVKEAKRAAEEARQQVEIKAASLRARNETQAKDAEQSLDPLGAITKFVGSLWGGEHDPKSQAIQPSESMLETIVTVSSAVAKEEWEDHREWRRARNSHDSDHATGTH